MSTTPRHIPFGIMLQGPGSHMHAWKHPSNPADASVNLQFYIDIARTAEDNGIAFGFVADGLYINEKSIPHFLNRCSRRWPRQRRRSAWPVRCPPRTATRSLSPASSPRWICSAAAVLAGTW